MGGLGDKVQIVDEIERIRFCNPRDPEYVMAPEHCCSSFVIAHVEATDLHGLTWKKAGKNRAVGAPSPLSAPLARPTLSLHFGWLPLRLPRLLFNLCKIRVHLWLFLFIS